METKGIVSVWIGKGKNRETFNRLLEYKISDSEDMGFVACPFCQALGIERYDPDYFGGRFLPKDFTNPKMLFHGTEIASAIEVDWPLLSPSNCYVLLYNIEYIGERKDIDIDGFSFHFLGCYPSMR